MNEYRERYGTEIRHPAWWREECDHNALATDVLPSRDWLGREGELRDFKQWQDRVNLSRVRRQTPRLASFMKAFYSL